MRFEEARNYLLNKLETELPSKLNYHNTQHTRDVLSSSEDLAATENLSDYDLLLLKTAAIYHDAGFLQVYTGHEEESCKMAAAILPDFDYSPEDIQEICRMIRATHLPQEPHDKKSKILCDADLYYIFWKSTNILPNRRLTNFPQDNTKTWLQFVPS
jgi:HD superfamily phosphodiesterase